MPPRGKKTPLKKPSPSAKSPATRIAKEPTSVQELESLPNIEEEKTVPAEEVKTEVSDLKTVTAEEGKTEVRDLKTVTAEEEKTEVSDLKTEAHLSSETVKGDKEDEVSEKAEEMEDELEDQVKEEKEDEGFEDPEEIMEGEVQENEEEVPEGQEDGMDVVNLEDDEEGSDEEEEIIDGTEEGDANEATEMDQDPGTNQEVIKEETRTDEVDNTERDGADVTGPSENREKSASDDEEDDEGNEDEEDPSVYMHVPLSDRKKEKEFEIFVGGLDKGAVEEDLRKVFGEYGEVQSVRIVKHPTTKKSKGYAFIRYGTIEQAKNVLTELKDGTEVKGKLVGISASQDNDTLYMSNICRTWTKEHLLETLKGYGVEQIEEICLPEDDKNEGKNKGFALLEFSTHSVAMTAFQRLRKPDAVFGCDRSARVSFAQSSMNPSEEALSQVKTVYVEGLPGSWDEEQVKDHCKEYGEIEKIQLSRNFTTARRKDFGFISFASRENAVACVEGINNAQIGEGNTKMKANLAKPHNKSRLAKQGPRGGFKVKKDVESSGQTAHTKKAKGKAKSKGPDGKAKSNVPEGKAKSSAPEGKGKAPSSLKNGKGGHPLKPQGKVSGVRGDAPTRDSQRKQQSKGGKHGGKSTLPDNNPRSSKKSQGKMHGRPSNDSGNRKNSRFGKPKENYLSRPASGYAAASGTKRQYSDMEPHAGYLRPAAKQSRRSYGHEQRSAGGYKNYASPRAGYVAAGPVPQPTYGIQYSGYSGYEPAYVYPSSSGPYPPSSGVYQPYSGAYAPSGGIYPPPRHYY